MNRKRTYSSAAMRGKRSRDIGANGETLVRAELARLGMREIRRVHTPWKIIRNSTGQIVDAVPQESVEGDFRCIDQTGKSVLVEAKTHTATDRVVWSDFEDHQIDAMDRHVQCNGRAFIAVVLNDRAFVLSWPIEGFGPGRSIKIVQGRLFLSAPKGKGRPPKEPPRCEGDVPPAFPASTNVHLFKIAPTA